MIYDLHIHSIYSKDSFLKPVEILHHARKKGLSGVAITDHNSIKGGIMCLKLNSDDNFHVIVGSEIKTEYGDLIGLFLQEDIKSVKFIETVEEIKDQGGLAILAHPFRKEKKLNSDIPSEYLKKVDCIEVFNARSPHFSNLKAFNLAIEYKKPMSAGSDAHLGFEIGRGKLKIDTPYSPSEISNANIISESKVSNYYFVHGMSYVIENIKKYIPITRRLNGGNQL